MQEVISADWKVVGIICLELVRQIGRRARTLQRSVVDIQKRLKAELIQAA